MKSILTFISNIGNYILDWYKDYKRERIYKKFTEKSRTANASELKLLRDEWLRHTRKNRYDSNH